MTDGAIKVLLYGGVMLYWVMLCVLVYGLITWNVFLLKSFAVYWLFHLALVLFLLATYKPNELIVDECGTKP